MLSGFPWAITTPMLRTERRIKMVQAIWRTLAVSSLAGGLIWATTRPIWVLRESDQVVMKVNNSCLTK